MALSISGCPFQSVPLRDQQLDAAEGLQRPTQPIDTDEPLQDQAQGQDPCVALPLTQGHALPSPSTLQTIEPLAGREYWEARMGFKMLRPEGVQNKLTRRQLRQLDRPFPLEEISEHRFRDDIWIAIDGQVYDITEHLVNHPDWYTAGITTPLSILAHGGSECSAEFHNIHRSIPLAYKQLPVLREATIDWDDSSLFQTLYQSHYIMHSILALQYPHNQQSLCRMHKQTQLDKWLATAAVKPTAASIDAAGGKRSMPSTFRRCHNDSATGFYIGKLGASDS